MNSFVRNMINGMIVAGIVAGFLILFGSVGQMDLNYELRVPDEPETIRWAVIGGAVMIGSMVCGHLRGMI